MYGTNNDGLRQTPGSGFTPFPVNQMNGMARGQFQSFQPPSHVSPMGQQGSMAQFVNNG